MSSWKITLFNPETVQRLRDRLKGMLEFCLSGQTKCQSYVLIFKQTCQKRCLPCRQSRDWCHRTLAGPIGYQHSCDLRVRLMNMIISYCRRLRFPNNGLFWIPLSAYGVTHLFSTNGCDKFEIVNDHITLFCYYKVLGKFKTWKKWE